MKKVKYYLIALAVALAAAAFVIFLPEFPGMNSDARAGLISGDASIYVGHYNSESVLRGIKKEIARDPEIMYVSSYTYSWLSGTLKVKYRTVVAEQLETMYAKLREYSATISKANDDIYAKVLAVNDLICAITSYDHEAAEAAASEKYLTIPYGMEDAATPYGVFVLGKAICQGYASATSLLLTELDIPNIIQIGTYRGVPHAWVKVKIGGSYYNLDTTNNDSNTPYAVFLSSDASLKDYTFEDNIESGTTELYNYYRRSGQYASSLQEFETAIISEYLDGKRSIAIKYEPSLVINLEDMLRHVKESIHFNSVDYGEESTVAYFNFS